MFVPLADAMTDKRARRAIASDDLLKYARAEACRDAVWARFVPGTSRIEVDIEKALAAGFAVSEIA